MESPPSYAKFLLGFVNSIIQDLKFLGAKRVHFREFFYAHFAVLVKNYYMYDGPCYSWLYMVVEESKKFFQGTKTEETSIFLSSFPLNFLWIFLQIFCCGMENNPFSMIVHFPPVAYMGYCSPSLSIYCTALFTLKLYYYSTFLFFMSKSEHFSP